MFLSFEGVDCVGKSTQIERVRRLLCGNGYEVHIAREPGGTGLGEELRKILKYGKVDISDLAELFLFAAARTQNVVDVILNKLSDQCIVICDRFTDSTVAYQGYGRAVDMETIKMVNEVATGGLYPDLTILLDMEPDKAISRATGGLLVDRFESEDSIFRDRVRKGFLKIAESEKERFAVIDSSRDVDSVYNDIVEAIRQKTFLRVEDVEMS